MSDIEILPAVILGPDKPDYSVIWLHGLGADGHDFEPIAADLDFPNKSKTRFIFPHAPNQSVTINAGHVMPAWYDIFEISEFAQEDEQGIQQTEKKIASLIENEIKSGVSANNIVLAGFSQGGAMALHTALRFSQSLAGILALSSYLPLSSSLASERKDENLEIPIMMMHGDYDAVVPIKLAQTSKQCLFELGWSVQWQTYPMEHNVCPEQIDDISKWFAKVLV
jgi:phospholipase/carboxylesterase